MYLYNEKEVERAVEALRTNLKSIDKIFYAIKANPHPRILQMLNGLGLGFECVSPGEVRHVMRHCPSLDPQRLLFTPNFASKDEYQWALQLGKLSP
jgi:bifunctional diaminopimelate decarboxylase / aspartate kinase